MIWKARTGVRVLLGTDVVQLNDVATLVAALNRTLTSDLKGKDRLAPP